MARGWAVSAAAGIVLVAACRESITAPGSCPDYCPSTEIVVLDTVLTEAIVGDSSYDGYVLAPNAAVMQLTSTASGLGARAAIRFAPLVAAWVSGLDTLEIVSVDSFVVSVQVLRRATVDSALMLDVYRLPPTIDSLVTWESLTAYFDDSLLIGSGEIPDSVTSGKVDVWIAGDAFPTLQEDSMVAAIGIVLRSTEMAYVDLGAVEASAGTQISRYLTVSVGGEPEERGDQRTTAFDALVAPDAPVPSPTALAVGGVSAARAVLRTNLPAAVIDSSSVLRATLILPLAAPIRGVLGDSVALRAEALLADVGAKSPYSVANPSDTRGMALLDVGQADTAYLDVTHLLNAWRLNTSIPRALLLRVSREGGSVVTLWLQSTRGADAPALHVTYAPLAPEEK